MEGMRVLIILYLAVSCSRIYDVTGFQFKPKKVFFEKSSRLSLYGEDLSTTNYSDSINVTVCQQPCLNVTNKRGNITCFVEERPFKGTYKESCNVTVSSLNIKEVTGEANLTFVWPQFLRFSPTHGHVSGGTTVTFRGRDLNVNRTILITVANVTCNINETGNQGNASVLLCETGKSFSETPYCGSVETTISNSTPSIMNDSFCYHENPTITDVSPNMTIESGGITLTVLGENFKHDRHFEWQIDCLNKSRKGHCSYNSENVLMCRIFHFHHVTGSYFQKNKSALYVDAQLFLRIDKSATNSTKFMGIHRDPKFNYVSPQGCDSSRNTVFIEGQYFSEFISSRVNVTTFNNRKCQMQYINESFMACHLNVDKTKQQGRNEQGDNSTETTTPGSRAGSTRQLPTATILKQESLHTKGITITEASKKKLKPNCPLTIIIGNIKELISETEVIHLDDSLKILMRSVAGSVIVVLVVLVVILTVKLRKINTLKKKEVNIHLTEIYPECLRKSSPTLREILDSVVQADNLQDIKKLIFDLDLLTVGKCIGSGNFGCVYEGFLKLKTESPQVRVALKTLQDNVSHNLDLLAFVQEALIMKDFQNPNVMGLVGLAEKEPGVPYVILPFMDKGDLLTYVREPAVTLVLHDVIKFGADIANGMAYLSSLKLVHRDLAARNCMLDSNHCVKVADFGLCRDIYEKGYYTSDNKKKLPIRWMALESIEHGDYSVKSDAWSLGVVLWEMLTRGLTPYPGVDGWDVVNFLRRRRLPPPYFCPESLYNLMMVCWADDPIKRPTFENIKSELLLLLGHNSSSVTSKGQSVDTNMDQKHGSQSSSGDVCNNKEGEFVIKQFSKTQDCIDCFLKEYSTLENKTPDSRKVSTDHETTLKQSKEEESVLAKVFISDSKIDGLAKIKTDNSITSSGVSMLACMAKPKVLKNFEITMPECFSAREVSQKSIELYHYLVDKYESPRHFTDMVSSLNRKLSKRRTDKYRQEIKMRYQIKPSEGVSESSSRSEDKDPGDGGAYHILLRRPSGSLSSISNDSGRSCQSIDFVSTEATSVTLIETTAVMS